MAALGLVLTLAALIVILKQAGSTAPPELSVQLVSVREMGLGDQRAWVAEVEIRNTGDQTAAAVHITGGAGETTADASLDYAPGHGRERLSLVFPADPGPHPDLRIRGWSEP